jgi:hypothetical protein
MVDRCTSRRSSRGDDYTSEDAEGVFRSETYSMILCEREYWYMIGFEMAVEVVITCRDEEEVVGAGSASCDVGLHASLWS